MNKYLLLTRTLLKTNTSSNRKISSTKKILSAIGALSLIALVLVPICYGLFELFKIIGDVSIIIIAPLVLFLTSFIIFFFSLFTVPSIYYYSNDLQTILPLPFSSTTIIAAKITITYLYELIFSVPILMTVYVAFTLAFGFQLSYTIFTFIAIFTVPVLPIIYSSILMMGIIGFTPLFKNKERFVRFSGIFGIIIAFGFSFLSGRIGESITNITSTSEAAAIGTSMMRSLNYLFPTNILLAENAYSLKISIVLYLVFIAVIIGVFLVIAKKLYFKGALNISDSSSKQTALSNDTLTAQMKNNSQLFACIKRELRTTRRNTTVLLNSLLSPYLITILLIGSMYLGIGDSSNTSTLDMISEILSNSKDLIFFALLTGVGFGMLISMLSSFTSTAFSREGDMLKTLKQFPIPYVNYANAKIIAGYIYYLPLILLTAIGLYAFLNFSILSTLAFTIGGILGYMLSSNIGLFIDMIHPKLNWTNEVAAIKQNMNVAIHMILMLVFALAFIAGSIFLFAKLGSMWIPLILSTTILVLLIVITTIGLKGYATKLFNNI